MPLLNSEFSVGCWVKTTKEATPVQGYNFRIGLLLWLLGTQQNLDQTTSVRGVWLWSFQPQIFNQLINILTLGKLPTSLPVPQFLFLNEKRLNKHKMWFANMKYSYQCDMMNSLFLSPLFCFFLFLRQKHDFTFSSFLFSTLRTRNRLSNIETKHPC